MPEKVGCTTCDDAGKIVCPSCSGRGGMINHFYPLGLGKSYSCSYCNGFGNIRCPRCNNERTIFQEQGLFTDTLGVLHSWIQTRLFHEKRIL